MLLIVYEPAAVIINPLPPLVKEETRLRNEISELTVWITREKRRCAVKDCSKNQSPETTSLPPVDVTPRQPSVKEPADTPKPPPQKEHVDGLIFVVDCSVTMGLHVNTGPNVEQNLIKGLKNGDPQAEEKLQNFLNRTDARRIDRIKSALIDTLNAMPKTTEVGLVFTKDCGDTRVVPATKPPNALASQIQKLQYGGGKSLSLAFTKALKMVRLWKKNGTIIIITDGADTCDQNLCQTVSELKKKLAPKVHLINMGRTERFNCLAKRSFTIHSPITENDLGQILKRIVRE